MNAITTSIPVLRASSKGYLRPSILWHLLNEGTASMDDLVRLIGSPRHSLHRQLSAMRTLGQVQRPPLLDEADRFMYGLTRAGIEAALRVDARDVEFAA